MELHESAWLDRTAIARRAEEAELAEALSTVRWLRIRERAGARVTDDALRSARDGLAAEGLDGAIAAAGAELTARCG